MWRTLKVTHILECVAVFLKQAYSYPRVGLGGCFEGDDTHSNHQPSASFITGRISSLPVQLQSRWRYNGTQYSHPVPRHCQKNGWMMMIEDMRIQKLTMETFDTHIWDSGIPTNSWASAMFYFVLLPDDLFDHSRDWRHILLMAQEHYRSACLFIALQGSCVVVNPLAFN